MLSIDFFLPFYKNVMLRHITVSNRLSANISRGEFFTLMIPLRSLFVLLISAVPKTQIRVTFRNKAVLGFNNKSLKRKLRFPTQRLCSPQLGFMSLAFISLYCTQV